MGDLGGAGASARMYNAENAVLKARLEATERENRELKRSVFELSSRLSQLQQLLARARSQPFESTRPGPEARAVPDGVRPTTNGSLSQVEMNLVRDVTRVNLGTLGKGDEATSESAKGVPSRLDRDLGLLLLSQEHNKQKKSQPANVRAFSCSTEFSDHVGAVYCCKWSPNGTMIASGSLDKSVIVRQVERGEEWEEQNESVAFGRLGVPTLDEDSSAKSISLTGHEMLVSDVKWASDKTKLVSGSFDHTVRLWQLERGQATNDPNARPRPDHGWALQTYALDGLVQNVEIDPENDNLFWGATSKGTVSHIDSRVNKAVLNLDMCDTSESKGNNSSIYALHAPSGSPSLLLTGDSRGIIRTFDRRTNTAIPELTILNEAASRPITHITSSLPGNGYSRMLAVNSYDNVLRVYDSGALSTRNLSRNAENRPATPSPPPQAFAGQSEGGRLVQPMRVPCLVTLTGHRNKNWPIRSSFYCPVDSGGSPDPSWLNSPQTEALREELNVEDQDLSTRMLLATGSASTSVYVFSLGRFSKSAKPEDRTQSAQLVQKLTGHSGRVYAVDFLQNDMPQLVSCSGDGTVRLWAPG